MAARKNKSSRPSGGEEEFFYKIPGVEDAVAEQIVTELLALRSDDPDEDILTERVVEFARSHKRSKLYWYLGVYRGLADDAVAIRQAWMDTTRHLIRRIKICPRPPSEWPCRAAFVNVRHENSEYFTQGYRTTDEVRDLVDFALSVSRMSLKRVRAECRNAREIELDKRFPGWSKIIDAVEEFDDHE